jgi:hypothetical protein
VDQLDLPLQGVRQLLLFDNNRNMLRRTAMTSSERLVSRGCPLTLVRG